MDSPPRSVKLTQVTEWRNGEFRSAGDCLAAEEPLQILLSGKPLAVTMRTPGHDRELAAGFLWSEGIIESHDQIHALITPQSAGFHSNNILDVQLRDDAIELDHSQRSFISNSSCGVCGKASIDAVRSRGLRPVDSSFSLHAEILCSLPDRLRAHQSIFQRTGGLHAAALFSSHGELIVLREDIGRHNAVDKIIGWALLQNLIPLSNHALLVSGRGGFEIVQKAITAGVPIVASVSAPSSLAVQLAREFGLTLIGFLRGQRFVVYSGESRCQMRRPHPSGEPAAI